MKAFVRSVSQLKPSSSGAKYFVVEFGTLGGLTARRAFFESKPGANDFSPAPEEFRLLEKLFRKAMQSENPLEDLERLPAAAEVIEVIFQHPIRVLIDEKLQLAQKARLVVFSGEHPVTRGRLGRRDAITKERPLILGYDDIPIPLQEEWNRVEKAAMEQAEAKAAKSVVEAEDEEEVVA